MLRPPNGFTYPGSAGAVTTLKVARNMVIKQAEITPFEIDLREQIVYTALSRAKNEGEGAFASMVSTLFKGMKIAGSNRLEAAILLGQSNLGVIELVTDLGGNLADLTITAATWAPGLWWAVGQEATLDAFTSTIKNNGSGPLIIKGLTAASRKVRVSYTGTLVSEITAGDTLWFEGAWDGTTYFEMPGVIAQASNVSGTSLGLSAATYPNWAGNTYSVTGNISSDVVEDACSSLRDRGIASMLSFYIGNKGFSVLMNELKQLRLIDSSYNPEKGKTGFKSVQYYSPNIGDIEVINHPFMKQGDALLQVDDECARVGSSDITFGVPGMPSEELFRLVDGSNAVEFQMFTDQAVINKKPSSAMYLSGITYT
jgi:hypothetical protein